MPRASSRHYWTKKEIQTARCVSPWSAAAVPVCNTRWIWWMDRKSATFSFQPPMSVWLSIQKARSSSAVRCSITATICKKAGSKSRTRTRSRIAPAARALLSDQEHTIRIASVHLNLRGNRFQRSCQNADRSSEKHSRFYPTRATGKRDHTEHPRNSESFRLRQPDIGHAVHRRARTQRFPRSTCTQGARFDYTSSESPHYRRPDLWTDSSGHVHIDRADDRRTCFSRHAVGQYFKESRNLCFAGSWRLDDRGPYCRSRHRDFGRQQRGAQWRHRSGLDRWRNNIEALRDGAWPALFEGGEPTLSEFDSGTRAEDSGSNGIAGSKAGAAKTPLRAEGRRQMTKNSLRAPRVKHSITE